MLDPPPMSPLRPYLSLAESYFASATHFKVASQRSCPRCMKLPKWQARELPAHVVYPAQRRLPLRVRTFIDFAVNYMSTVLKRAQRPGGSDSAGASRPRHRAASPNAHHRPEGT
jgi:hypothetical protein